MRPLSTESNRKTSFTDIHDIRALTDTGEITLPFGAISARKPSDPDPDAVPAS